MNFIEIFKKTAAQFPDKSAVADLNGKRFTSYRELDELSGKAAGKLNSLGIGRGDFVAVLMGRQVEYLAAYLGILKAGAAVVPLIPDYPQERIDYIIGHCNAKLVIKEEFFSDTEKYDCFENPASDSEAALLVYTSGSTGVPKGILHSAGDIARAALRHKPMLENVSPLVMAQTGQFSFATHIFECLSVFYLAGTVHIVPNSARKSADGLLSYLVENSITIAWVSPQMLRILCGLYKGEGKIQTIICGGERITYTKSDYFRIINCYGMSEFAGIVTIFDIDKEYKNTPIGKAMGGIKVRIYGGDGKEGEIIADGRFDTVYYKDKERTERVFEKQKDGLVSVHTGDIGYFDKNGNLNYVNRKDWMVKVNGQRVETLEIETLMSRMEEIDISAVKAFEDEDGQTYLVAYYVLNAPLDEAKIRERLERKLAPYMIPRFFVSLEEMPKNINGKLDRKALTPPDKDIYKATYKAPRNDLEKALCSAFEKVLYCKGVGINDDFFALGGDSIKVIKLIGKAGISGLNPDKILLGKTPENIAKLCGNDESAVISHLESIPEISPLGEAQRGVYFECAENLQSVMYNIPMLCRLPVNTDINKFISAVKTVAGKHKAFCVTVSAPDGDPVMIYREKEITVCEKTVSSIEEECEKFVTPFDLENGPLYRFEIVKSGNETAFLFDVHHIIFDGTSADAFISQIAAVYSGEDAKSEELTLFDISEYEKTLKTTKQYKEAEEFFKAKLDGNDCESAPIPDVITSDVQTGAGRVILSTDEKFTQEGVMSFVKEHKISENTLFLGAFAYTLAKMGMSEESAFCTVNNGRHDRRLSDSVGMFVKTLPIYCSIDEKSSVSDFLLSVQDDFYRTMKHDCISFASLAKDYGVNTGIVFIYQAELFEGAPIENGKIEVIPLETADIQSNIDVMLIKTENGYKVMAHFKKSLYTEEFIRNFVDIYLNVLSSMMKENKLCDISLTDKKITETLDSFNQTEQYYDNSLTVVDLFRAQVKKTSDNICLVYCDKKYTYKQVDNLTDNLARYLVSKGIGREKVVGILIPRCENMLICALAVLKAGGAYLPLDPTYPKERLNLMVEDSGAVMLIFDSLYADVIDGSFKGIRMNTDEIKNIPSLDISLKAPKPQDLFVMLYTSGSTGKPKGVMFEHSNTLVTAKWVKKYFNVNSESRLTLYASYGFDAHAFDMYSAIISGAQLHIIPEDIRLDLIALQKYYNDNQITHTVMTTQLGRQFALLGGFKTLKHLSVAGEKLTPPEVPDGFTLYNLYGPTEGSVVTSAFAIDRKYKDVPIGKPVDNLKAYIVDKNGKRLPCGAVGELWIAGPHVTRGYLNRPDKNAEAYGENPFEKGEDYGRVYRTGDIVRLLCDGNLQFVGRRDAQVKIRGFRVELTEIEEVIRRFDGIKDATVAAFDDKNGGKYVAAYIVSDKKTDIEKLNEFIRKEKPPYMVPAVTMQIDSVPLNQNGKVNKKALPVPVRKITGIVPPENGMQKKIFTIISEVIGHSDFGITTDIYEAGLTSIGAVKLNVGLSKAFGIPFKIADIKENSTVKKLEQFILSSKPQETYEILEDYPISNTQSGIFVECMASPDTTAYNIPVLIKLDSTVDTEKLVTAVLNALRAHPYITCELFTDKGGNVRAKRNNGMEPKVKVIECDTLPENSALIRPFRLLSSPLYRVELYKTANGNYLFMDFHHIICDGTSESILFNDIDAAFFGKTPEKETFTGFEAALEEEKALKGNEYKKAKEYWKNLLGDCDTACLPNKTPEAESGVGNLCVKSTLTRQKTEKFCNENSVTQNALFNAAFSFVLGAFTGKESVTYATVYNGRNDSRLSRSVTMLVKTLPVKKDITKNAKIKDFANEMSEQLVNSISNDIYSFASLCADFGVNSDVIFIYQGEDFVFDSLCGKPSEFKTVASDNAKAPVSINVYLKKDRFEYVAEYRKDHYCESFIKALCNALDKAVDEFCEKKYIKDVSLLDENAELMYARLNDNDMPVSNKAVYELIGDIAKLTPDKAAVTAAGKTITFRELDERSNAAANALIKMGVKSENIIGLILERSVEVFITEIAIMKAGGAFLPMLPSYPDERLEYCLTDSESPFVITTEQIKAQKGELLSEDKPYKVLTVESLLEKGDISRPEISVLPENMAYCIYTSGSTGTPKGVMIEHHNFSNFVQTIVPTLNFYNDTSLDGTSMATSSISFDMSLYETYVPLCFGRSVYMASEEEYHNPMQLKEQMIANKVQMMTSTPSFMNNIVSIPEFKEAIKGLKTIVVGAEAFPSSLYTALHEISPDLQIVNGYGPTETTVCCSQKPLTSGKGITIGRPTGNAKMFVVDKEGHVLPPYAIGELIICGECVGRGYVKLPDKTKAAYFTLNGYPAYHSGDSVRLNGNAEIEFGGRIDNQVKLRGFRVELDEIEKVMVSYGEIKQSKVIVRNNGTEDYLAGFFTATEKIDIDSLTAFLKSRLTYYMVPASLMQLDKMPLTPNGKIDKKAFPEVTKTVRKTGRKAPKKSLEQRLCEIFASVLGTEEIYADDNFFELGGTSLSASKVTMVLMSEGIEVKYGDIFDNPTPESLAGFIEERDGANRVKEIVKSAQNGENTRDALKYNTVKYAPEAKREPLGNVLLTGAVGFLGIHVLRELLSIEKGHIWCLVRKGEHKSPEIRLKAMLIYYFSDAFEEEISQRVTVIDADITDKTLSDTLKDIPFDTVINCAACVKHFSDSDILEQINLHGVENLIDICRKRDAKLIQISTVSVCGIHTEETYEKQIRMHENELFVIDDMDNKYAISKYKAELKMFEAVENGMRGKVIRVGNLMGRHSDGEFQANMETNMFMSGIRGFAVMGKYPISHMTDPMRFSPVDCTARAVVLLAGVNDKFTAFNTDNRYGFDEMKIIDACNRNGITILPEQDEVYYREFRQKLGDGSINAKLTGLAAYDIKDAHAVDTDNMFTTNILYRIGFSWPLVDDTYLDKAIHSIMTLDYFNIETSEDK